MVGQTPKVQLVQAVGMLVMMRRRPGAGLAVLEAGRDERSPPWPSPGAGPPTAAATGTASSSKCL